MFIFKGGYITKIQGIYKIENMINNKIYIGQSNDINRRFKRHQNDLNKNKHRNIHLQYAWNKYGKDSFNFNIIEECYKECLNDREMYWIKYFDSFYNGYNLTIGGSGNSNSNSVSNETKIKISESLRGENSYSAKLNDNQVKQIKLLLLKGFSNLEISKIMNINCTLIYGIKSCKNWSHILPELNDQLLNLINNNNLTVEMVEDIKKQLLNAEYNIINNLAEQYNVTPATIYRIRQGKIWSNILPDITEQLKKKFLKKDPINKRVGKVICDDIVFNSAKACANYYDTPENTLRSWLKGDRTMPERFRNMNLSYI